MKKLFLAAIATFGLSICASAQYTKDGRPDMRYKSNRETYGGYYNGGYSTPRSSYPSTAPSYTNPYTGGTSSYPSFPTKKDGTPDRRYKENRYPYNY